jgi:hypothetical protein
MRLLFVAFMAPLATAAIDIDLRYDYDTNGFFTTERREMLELAVDSVNRFLDTFDPIEPSGNNTWRIGFERPDTGVAVELTNPTIARDTMVLYVGGKNMGIAGQPLAVASSGDYDASGSQSWLDTIAYRGEDASGVPAPSDYGPWGGIISFNMSHDWSASAGDLPGQSDQFDLYTVAAHELLHVFGIGRADSWKVRIEDGAFIGQQAQATGSSNNPSLALDAATEAHWLTDTQSEPVFMTQSTVVGQTQAAIMNTAIYQGERRFITELDRAALRDIGWQEALAGDVDRDGDIDIFDVLQINNAGKFSASELAGWSDGDADGNAKVDIFDVLAINQALSMIGGLGQDYTVLPQGLGEGDLGSVFAVGGTGSTFSAVTIVPEPATMALLGIGGLALIRRPRAA